MKRIVIVGGGYAGFYTALSLEKHLIKSDGVEVIVVDPRPYMTYEPFLPEVAAGSIEPRHALVSLRKSLSKTRIIAGNVVSISHADKHLVVRPHAGDDYPLHYDIIVVTAGAITRTFPVDGLKEFAIGLKHIEEAIGIRDRLLTSFDRAASLPKGHERARLLTAVVVGGGFTGVEAFGELYSLATSLLRQYPELRLNEIAFHLVQASDRIMPEMSAANANRVMKSLEHRGAIVHLNSRVISAIDGNVVLTSGERFDSNLIVWAAGNDANPIIANHTDLPVDTHGFLVVQPDLRVGTENVSILDAWGAGDNASVPDLAGGSPTSRVVPNAQNALRQAHLLAKNIVASLRGGSTNPYFHRNLGTLATLGLGTGAFQSGRVEFVGFTAWLIHRAYHLYALPTWERRFRVAFGWLMGALFGRDIVSLEDAQHPRDAFVRAGIPPASSTSDQKPNLNERSVTSEERIFDASMATTVP